MSKIFDWIGLHGLTAAIQRYSLLVQVTRVLPPKVRNWIMNLKKICVTAVLATALAGSGTAAAYATTNYPVEGGTWTYGLSTGLVNPYSNYWQGSRCHTSSVENDWGHAYSIRTIAGQTSHAETSGNVWTHNNYYYNVC